MTTMIAAWYDHEKIRHRVESIPETGCWLWTGALWGSQRAYGQMWANARHVMAHRFTYELVNGPIPEGLVIDHKCRVRSCVNPDHLRVVTPRQNSVENSVGASAQNAVKTHCPQGHPYSGDNLYVAPSTGVRHCRACGRLRQQGYRANRAALVEATK